MVIDGDSTVRIPLETVLIILPDFFSGRKGRLEEM